MATEIHFCPSMLQHVVLCLVLHAQPNKNWHQVTARYLWWRIYAFLHFKWHFVCDLQSCSLLPCCECWAKLPKIPWNEVDILKQVKHRNCKQLMPQFWIYASLRPKIWLSNWISCHIIATKHGENRTAAFPSPLLYQACTQTSEMDDQMDLGVLIPSVRNMNRQCKSSRATN